MVDKLVSVSWLQEHLQDENLVLLDASVTYDANHTIHGAQHFDIKNVFSNTKSPFPNTIPSTSEFERESRKLGIHTNSHIVVFDDKGIFTSPRVWWMFMMMGHSKVSVLDGGLPAWSLSNIDIEQIPSVPKKEGTFTVHMQQEYIKTYEDIIENISTSAYIVLDARSQGRFEGKEPEPRTHIKSGHIPNSLNLPYIEVLENGKYKSPEQLRVIFDRFRLGNKPIIFTCGSGISACIILLALEIISDQEKSVYDGSWTEWAEKQRLFTRS